MKLDINPLEDSMFGFDESRMLELLYAVNYRHYHNHEHLMNLWALYRDLETDKGPRIEVMTIKAIIAWHDAIYIPGNKDNEKLSNDLYNLYATFKNPIISETILASADHFNIENDDCSNITKMFLDFDIWELGSDYVIYSYNGRLIIKEALDYIALANPNMSSSKVMDTIIKGRKSFLKHALDAPKLFRVYTWREKQARENIERELKELES